MSTNAQYPTGIHYSPSKWRSGEKEHLQAGSVATKDQLSFVSRRDRHADQISVLPNGASQKSNHSVRSILLSKKGLNITVLSSFKRINELWSVPAMNRVCCHLFSPYLGDDKFWVASMKNGTLVDMLSSILCLSELS